MTFEGFFQLPSSPARSSGHTPVPHTLLFPSLAASAVKQRGTTGSATKYYRSKDGRWLFKFEFVQEGAHVAIYCHEHPPLGDRDSHPSKTHLFHSGKLCFAAGREPTNHWRAEALAKQWAEYFLEYRRTGMTQR